MISRILKKWILVSFAITGVCATIYWAVQQNYRQTANDPQIQMAEDASNSLSSSGKVGDFNTEIKIDISKSLAPFVIIYDVKGNPIASSGNLDGKDPVIPSGVFDFVKSNGLDKLTWEPQSGVRIAAVVDSFNSATQSGYVLAGRNMREVETRIEKLAMQIGIGWAATVFGSLVLIGILEIVMPTKKK